jgi:outer membrane protein assembly factor BamE (lipoprotein component of BamABCDE complex)
MKKSITQSALKAAKLSAILVFGSVAASQLTGCVTVGQEFAAHRVAEIKIGQTKRQEITELFGTPWRTGMEDGRPTWTYGIYKYALFGGNDSQDLLIRFDPQGIVRSYTFNSTRK